MLPLFDSRPVYIFDISFVTRIDGMRNPERIWDRVIRLIEEDRLFTLPQVMDDLERIDPAAYARLAPFSTRIVLPIDREKLLEAGRISQSYDGLATPYHPEKGTIPWLIAAAGIGGFIIVTGTMDTCSEMANACRCEGIVCLDMAAFKAHETVGVH